MSIRRAGKIIAIALNTMLVVGAIVLCVRGYYGWDKFRTPTTNPQLTLDSFNGRVEFALCYYAAGNTPLLHPWHEFDNTIDGPVFDSSWEGHDHWLHLVDDIRSNITFLCINCRTFVRTSSDSGAPVDSALLYAASMPASFLIVLLVAPLLFMVGVAIFRRRRRVRRIDRGLCPECAFNLSSQTAGPDDNKCPKCGTSVARPAVSAA